MLTEIILAIVQAGTEFLPISSSGHLALFSNLFSEVNLFLFTTLHLASLLAVIVYTRKEIKKLISFDKGYLKMWLYLFIGILPAGIFGLFLKDYFEILASNYLFVGTMFFLTGFILIGTRKINSNEKIGFLGSLAIGLSQVFALLPGVSRSGITISTGLYSGVSKKESFKFSFLMLIPLTIGAVILSWSEAFFSISILVAFIICFIFSFLFLGILEKLLIKNYFWVFGYYCFFVGLISIILGLF